MPVSRSNSAPSAATIDFTAPALMIFISATMNFSLLQEDRGRAKRFRLGADAFDRRAAAGELVLEPLEAAVEMIDAVDHGLALGRERGDHQRHRGAQIGRHHRRALQALDALDGRGLAVEMDAGAEPRQFLHMHEAVFENRFGDARGAAWRASSRP